MAIIFKVSMNPNRSKVGDETFGYEYHITYGDEFQYGTFVKEACQIQTILHSVMEKVLRGDKDFFMEAGGNHLEAVKSQKDN